MSAGGIGKMDPEEADGAPEDEDPYWNYQFAGSYNEEDSYCNNKSSPADYGGDLDMLGSENDINTLAVPLSPVRDGFTGASYQPSQSSQVHINQVASHGPQPQQHNQFDMSMAQAQQQPMQASGMLQQQVVHLPQQQQSQHIQTAQAGPSQPQIIQQAPQIFVQQPGASSANVQFQYMSNGPAWTTVPGQPGQVQQVQQVQQLPQQTVLQLNGSQYVLVNPQTSCQSIVASGAPIIQQQQRSVAMSTISAPNVTTISGGQPIVTSQPLPSDNSSVFPQEQILLPQGCLLNAGAMPNGRIVQVAAPINAQTVQQNHRVQHVQQPIMQQSGQPNLQQLLSTPSTSQTPVAPAPLSQQAPAQNTKKRPIRRKTPAVQNKKQGSEQAATSAAAAVTEARMSAEDAMEMTQITAEIARLQQLDPQGYSDQINNLTQRRNEILMKMLSGTALQQAAPSPQPTLQETPQPQTTPVQQHQYQPQRQPAKRAPSQTPQRPPAIRDPTPQSVYESVYDQKSHAQLIHSSHPSTSFESSQQPQQIYVQSSDSFPTSQPTRVLQYATTSQMSSYQPVQVAPSTIGVVSPGMYSASNVVNSLSSQPGGPVASCIITAQQQQEQQQRLLVPKPAVATPMKSSTAAAPQQPLPSPVPVIKLPPMKELALRISQKKETRTRRISRHFEEMRHSVEASTNVDVNTPFRNVSDVCRRLLPFALFDEPELRQSTIDKFDHEHLRISVHQNERKRRIEERLNAFYLKEATTPVDNTLIMLLSLDKEYERRKLAEETELVERLKNSTSEDMWTNFASTSEFRPCASEVDAEVEKKRTSLTLNEDFEKLKVAPYDYYDFSENRYQRPDSPNSLFSDADEEEERSLRILHRKRTRKDLRNLRRIYLHSIADDFRLSYKPPYSEAAELEKVENADESICDSGFLPEESPAPVAIKLEPVVQPTPTPVSVANSSPAIEKKAISLSTPQCRMETPQMHSTPPRHVTPQPPVPSAPVVVPQPIIPKHYPSVEPAQPTVPKMVIPVPATPVEPERKPCVMDLKTKMKRYRLEQNAMNNTAEKVNNENVNHEQNEHKVPPMKISRFNIGSLPSTSSTPVSLKSEKEKPDVLRAEDGRRVELKVEPLKLPLKLPSLKISIKKPTPTIPAENGVNHNDIEIEERSGKKKRKEKDKKKKHKERDKKKHRDKSKELENDAELKQKVMLEEMERQKMLKLAEEQQERDRLAREEQERQNELKKKQEEVRLKDEKVKEKNKEKSKDKVKDKSKDKDKDSKKEKKKKKKHRHDENAQDGPAQNGVHHGPPSTSISLIIRPPKVETPLTPEKIPKLKLKLPAPPPQRSPDIQKPETVPNEIKRPASSTGSSVERPNGIVEPLKIRFARKFQSDTAAKAASAESATPVVNAPPPPPAPPPKQEEKKKKKEKKEGGLKLKIKRLAPPSEFTEAPTTHHKKDRSSKKERDRSSSKAASKGDASIANPSASLATPSEAVNSNRNNSSVPAPMGPNDPSVEKIQPPIRMRIKPPPIPSQSEPDSNGLPPPTEPAVPMNPPLNRNSAPSSYHINSFLTTLSSTLSRGGFTPNCSDDESEADLRNRTDDLISRLTTNSKPCAQNSS